MRMKSKLETRLPSSRIFCSLQNLFPKKFILIWFGLQSLPNKISYSQQSPLLHFREAIFQLKRSSSPGIDGFSRAFFTNCWHIIGQEVISTVIHFFSIGRILREINAYFLSLISKKLSPESFSDFRPISLLNFT